MNRTAHNSDAPLSRNLSSAAFAQWRHHGQTHKATTRGTHRTVPLADSLVRARRFAASAGVTRVANVTGLDIVGLPVVAVYRPNARSLVVSQGKGLDLTAATVSGLMEAIESHHAEHAELSLRLATAAELSSRKRIADVELLPRVLGRSLPRHSAILWAEGIDLFDGDPRWVPYELVHTNFTVPLPAGSGFFTMSSNGLASGNHPAEAMSHAICELVERDAMALFAARGGVAQTSNRIDLTSVEDTDCARVLGLLEAADLAVGVWDITTDIGLPACVAVIVDRKPGGFRELYYATGSGCHPTREVAAVRALTEAVQCRLTYIAGARDDADRQFFERARDPERTQAMRRELERSIGSRRHFSELPSQYFDEIEDDVRWELACLRRAGLAQAVAIDLSSPGTEVFVFRIVIPGLESLSGAPGYVPGARAREAMLAAGRGST